ADWYLQLSDCAPAEKKALQHAFQEWLDVDPCHIEAFARVSATWDEVGNHATAPEMMSLRQSALEDVRTVGAQRWHMQPRVGRRLAVAASLAVIIISGIWLTFAADLT